MLPFPDFENHIDPVILQRGKAYFEEETVYDLHKSTKGIWTASVMGSELYRVKITQQKEHITDWQCTCPYDGGPVCKHVAAVLYAMKEEKSFAESEVIESKTNNKKTSTPSIEATIKKLSAKELKEALLYACRQYPQLRYELVARFASAGSNSKETVRTTIKQALQKALDRYGYMRSDKAAGLKRTANNFLQRAGADLQKEYYGNAADTLLALIEAVVPAMERADDSSGILSSIIEEAFGLLSGLVTATLPPQLSDELFTYCLKAFEHKMYSGWDGQWNWPYLAIALMQTHAEAEQLLTLLDKHIPKETGSWSDNFLAERIARIKLAVYEKIYPDKVVSFIERNLSFSSFRESAVRTAVNNSDFEKAKKLCNEGIKLASEKRLPGLVNRWYEWLLVIAQKQNNQKAIIETAEYLLDNSGERIQYYKLLQSILPQNEWPARRKHYITLLQRNHAIDDLMHIFIEEGDGNALEQLLTQVASLDLLSLYQKPLFEKFPDKMEALLPKLIYPYMEQSTGRSHYKKVAGLLKEAKKKPGIDYVTPIALKLRTLYPSRRALLDELKNLD